MRDAILILSNRDDFGVDAVVDALSSLGERVFRFDFADLQNTVLGAELAADGSAARWEVSLSMHLRAVCLDELKAVWVRHPSQAPPEPDLPWQVVRFVHQEIQHAFAGLLASHDCLFVNDPVREAVAHLKPYQLVEAARVGLRVPRSIITTDPEQLRAFHRSCGGNIICKALTGIPATTTSGEAVERSIPTTRVTAGDLDHAGTLRLAPGFFQELLPTPFQVRVTVVGSDMFAVRVDSDTSNSEGPVDWRQRGDLAYRPYRLPELVQGKLRTLLDKLGLEYAGIDLVATGGRHGDDSDGDNLCFLELNPRGQWGWIEAATSLPISAAIAKLLASGMPSAPGART